MADAPEISPRLIIDLRSGDGLDPATPILGLPLLRRAILAGRRAGFGQVVVWRQPSGEPLSSLLGGLASVEVTTEPPARSDAPTLIIPLTVLPEREWLSEVLEQGSASKRSFTEGPICWVAKGEQVDPDAVMFGGEVRGQTFLPLASPGDIAAAEDRLMSRLGKDTDGFMSRHFARPISLWVSRRVSRWPVTPNHMTVVSMALGLIGAPFFLSAVWWMQAIGGMLFVAHSVLDGCDGELARLKFAESRFGGLLDFWSDNIVHVAVFGCMGVGWALSVGHWWPLLVGLAAVLGAGGSALVVYWATLRQKKGAGPVYTSVSGGPANRASKMLDDLSRRDFIYLVFVLSLFGKAHWFLILTAIGAPVFLIALLIVLKRGRAATTH